MIEELELYLAIDGKKNILKRIFIHCDGMRYSQIMRYSFLIGCIVWLIQFSYAQNAIHCGLSHTHVFPVWATTWDVEAYGLCPPDTAVYNYSAYSGQAVASLILVWDTFTWKCEYLSGWAIDTNNVNSCNATRTTSSICGTISSLYASGLYINQWNAIFALSWANPLFCSSWPVNPNLSVNILNELTWWCWVNTCIMSIRPNQPTDCAINNTIGATIITTASTWFCMPGLGHTDSSVRNSIKIISFTWWWATTQPRSRVCGGDYHNQTSCTTPSKWLCGSAGSGNIQSFLSLSPTDGSLCANGLMSGFLANAITTSPFYTAQYIWSCLGSQQNDYKTCSAYKVAANSPGICNAGVNGQSLSYSQVKDALLCTQGIPSVTLLSPMPDINNKWTWTCMGLGGWSSVECNVNAVNNGICSTFTSPQSSVPLNLCVSGIPSVVSISSGSYSWICNGINWWISSNLCSVWCSNNICATTWSIITWGISTGGIILTWSDGKTSPISFNLICTDADGCVCYNVTIINWSRCLANNFTGVSDSIQSSISVGAVCTDADGCVCNSLNAIVNWSICQTDWLTWFLPWAADLVVYQVVSSWTIARRWQIDITIYYINHGPDVATWARLEYYLSPLISKFRTSSPYTLTQVISSGYIETSEYQNNVLVFLLGDIPSDTNGSITISLNLKAKITDKEITNATSIASRLRDSKPLDNTQKTIFWLDTQTATNLSTYVVNPLLTLQQIFRQYTTMNTWLSVSPVFADVQKGNDNYMSIMTVVRNGIFEGYNYTYSRKFEWDKCSNRIETVNVLAKMMYNAGSTDIYVSRPSGTAYIDTNGFSLQVTNFINRAHERGLIAFLNPKNIRGSLYFEPYKTITQWELKSMLNAIYIRYGLDTTILDSLLNDELSCVTRNEFADTVTTVLRGNPNVMMGYNDEFIKTVIEKTNTMSIIERRVTIQKILDKLRITTPSLLYENGYDTESLIGVLEAAMDGREYNPIITGANYTVSLAQSL